MTGEIAHLYEQGVNPDLYSDEDHAPRAFDRLPAVAVLLAPLGWLPPRAGFVVWTLLNAFAFLLAIRFCYRLVSRLTARPAFLWLALFLVLRFAWDSLNHGSIDPLLLLLVLAGLDGLERGKVLRGAVLTALAVVVEPVLVIIPLFLAVRGRGRALALTLAGIGLIAVVPPALTTGPGSALSLSATALQGRLPDLTKEMVAGESLRAMSCRILDHAPLERRGESLRTSLGIISRHTAERAWMVLGIGLLLLLVFRGPRRSPPLFWGMVLAAALLIDPGTGQSTYLLLMLPAASITAALMAGGVRGFGGTAALGCLLAALALAAIPARGIVGLQVALWFYALCASGFAALLLIIGGGLMKDKIVAS